MSLRVYPSSVAPFVLILPRIHAVYCALNSFVKAGLPILIVIMMKSVNSGKWSRPKSGFQVIITIALLELFNSSLVLNFPCHNPFFLLSFLLSSPPFDFLSLSAFLFILFPITWWKSRCPHVLSSCMRMITSIYPCSLSSFRPISPVYWLFPIYFPTVTGTYIPEGDPEVRIPSRSI